MYLWERVVRITVVDPDLLFYASQRIQGVASLLIGNVAKRCASAASYNVAIARG
jgi:hypothetical protein